MLTIRKIIPADYESLIQLLYEFDRDTKKFVSVELLPYETCKNPDQNIKETVRDYLENSKYLIYVAEVEGKSVGYICGEIQEKKYRIINHVGYVVGWFVKKEYRNKQIGKKLFDQLISDFKEKGCSYAHLDTFFGNTPAINIYHKLGFNNRLLELVKKI